MSKNKACLDVVVSPQDERLVGVVTVLGFLGDRDDQDVHAAVAVKVARDDGVDDDVVDVADDAFAAGGGGCVAKVLGLCKMIGPKMIMGNCSKPRFIYKKLTQSR